MSCDAPIQAYYGKIRDPLTNKFVKGGPMVFKPQGSHSGVRQLVPCGKCAGCRLDHSRVWAVRLLHENKMHEQSMFVTLTYDQDHLPHVGTLVKSHLQGFHKRYHNRLLYDRGRGIRYYGCGEYGSESRRPHYHSLIFGHRFDDLKFYKYNKRDEPIYTSATLNKYWKLGECKIGDVTFDSASYVARYCCKKVDGPMREAGHYVVYDAEGRAYERVPEFSHQSLKPGIGGTYFDKYGHEIALHDSIIVDGREVPSIRYYDLRIDPARLAVLKTNRRRKAVWSERQPDRRRVKEILRDKLAKLKERVL